MATVVARIRRFILSREWPLRWGSDWGMVVRSVLFMLLSVVWLVAGLIYLDWWFLAALPMFAFGVFLWPGKEKPDPASTSPDESLDPNP